MAGNICFWQLAAIWKYINIINIFQKDPASFKPKKYSVLDDRTVHWMEILAIEIEGPTTLQKLMLRILSAAYEMGIVKT